MPVWGEFGANRNGTPQSLDSKRAVADNETMYELMKFLGAAAWFVGPITWFFNPVAGALIVGFAAVMGMVSLMRGAKAREERQRQLL